MYRRLGGSQGRSGRVRKISPPPRFLRSTDDKPPHYAACSIPLLPRSSLAQISSSVPSAHVPPSMCDILISNSRKNHTRFNPLNAELNPICHLLALLGAHTILHISRIRVKSEK